MAFNSAFKSPGGDFLQDYLQGKENSNTQSANEFAYSPSNNFSIASTPKNAWYSLSETDKMRPYQPLGPVQQMRRGINDAVINTGNMFGQDWSGTGAPLGAYPQSPQLKQQWYNSGPR